MLIDYRTACDAILSGKDGNVGSIYDFYFEVRDWTKRHVVVDTGNWLPSRKVLISPQWIESISWADSVVSIDMTRKQIEQSPEYDHLAPISRNYEDKLYQHYGLEQCWLP